MITLVPINVEGMLTVDNARPRRHRDWSGGATLQVIDGFTVRDDCRRYSLPRLTGQVGGGDAGAIDDAKTVAVVNVVFVVVVCADAKNLIADPQTCLKIYFIIEIFLAFSSGALILCSLDLSFHF